MVAASRDGLQYQGISHVINLAGATNFFDEDDSGCSTRPQHAQPPHTTGYALLPAARRNASYPPTPHRPRPSAMPVRTVRAWGVDSATDKENSIAAGLCSYSFVTLIDKERKYRKPMEHKPC